MPRRQRLLFALIALVIAVVAVVVLVGTGDDPQPGGSRGARSASDAATPTPQAGASASATGTAGASATPAATPVLDGSGVQRIEATEGQRVRFAVTATSAQEVHVHGYDLKGDAAPGKPARFSFTASITGRFDIEYEGPGQQIGELEVQPR